MYPFLLAGTVIVSDQRTHSLDDSVCRKIQEGLQFIIHAEDHHIHLSVCSEDRVQGRNQQGRQCHIQCSRNSDGVDFL